MASRDTRILAFLDDADALGRRLVLAEVLGPRAPGPPRPPPAPSPTPDRRREEDR